MSIVAFKTVRQRVATAVAALSGWRQSAWALESFGSDPDQVQHHAFAVGITSSRPAAQPGRRNLSEGLATESQVQVTFAHRLTVDGQVAAVDAALDAEGDAITAVLNTADRTSLHIVWDSSDRAPLGDGWIVTTISFTAVHRI